MQLEMKPQCEKCTSALHDDSEAYICSFECTFCSACSLSFQNVCPHCGGELVPRPRRRASVVRQEAVPPVVPARPRPALIWGISFGVWTFVSLAATATIYEMYHLGRGGMSLGQVAMMEFSQVLTYAPLTPFAYAFALRYPIQRENWLRRSLAHLCAGILFTIAHIALRAATPYGYYDPVYKEWGSGLWNSHLHQFRNPLVTLRSAFLAGVVDDTTSVYLPVVIVAHAISYYRRFQERELRATQLQGQLAKAHLQSLKNQLQPHFLFNTLHSISALMLTDVVAADRMMTSLSDLLRLSLDGNETQITILAREIEFLQVYLDIEKTRFQDRLCVVYDIAPECLDAQVPHLLLQPIVENAVRHGISKRSSPGEIRVVARHDGQSLYLHVRDNGPGWAQRRDAEIEPDDDRSKHGLGLGLTRERLLALYGSEHNCELRNLPEGGAEVTLRIPFDVAVQAPPEEIGVPALGARRTGT